MIEMCCYKSGTWLCVSDVFTSVVMCKSSVVKYKSNLSIFRLFITLAELWPNMHKTYDIVLCSEKSV